MRSQRSSFGTELEWVALGLLMAALLLGSSGCLARPVEQGGRHAGGFHILDNPRQRSSRHGLRQHLRQHHHHHGPGDLLVDVLLGLRGDEQRPVEVRRAPQLGPATASDTQTSRSGRLRARSMFRGGHIELVGLPSRSRSHAVLAIRPVADLDPAPCDVRVYRDGVALPLGEVVRRGDHEVLMALTVDDLAAVASSTRFAGVACGREFALDQAGRATVANFAARFRERCDVLDARSVAVAR
jgi:hypothetical protein